MDTSRVQTVPRFIECHRPGALGLDNEKACQAWRDFAEGGIRAVAQRFHAVYQQADTLAQERLL